MLTTATIRQLVNRRWWMVIVGGWAHGDGRWQGFIGKDCFDVTIDLGKSTKISSVGTDFMQSSGPEIFYPSQYTVSVSEDSKTSPRYSTEV